MKRKLSIISGVVIIGILIFYIVHRINTQPDLINGQPAFDFYAERLDGQKMKLSDLRGNYILLDFWASWCAPCRKNNPKIVKLYETFHNAAFKDAEGFEIVSVALEKSMAPWPKAIEADKLDWQYHIVDLPSGEKLDNGKIADLYGVVQIPATFLIDPEGMIIGVDLSARKMEKLLEKKIKK